MLATITVAALWTPTAQAQTLSPTVTACSMGADPPGDPCATLLVGPGGNSHPTDPMTQYRTFIEFDATPPGGVLQSATVRATVLNPATGYVNEARAYRGAQEGLGWTEADYGADPSGSDGLEFDITQIVRAWHGGAPNMGVVLTDMGELSWGEEPLEIADITVELEYATPNMTSSQAWGTAPNAGDLRLGDVNGDGAIDALVHEAGTGTLRLALSQNEQYASWSAAGTWPTGRQLVLADVNGDGLADAVGRDGGTQTLHVALSDGDSFGAAASWGTWNSAYDARFADLNGDHQADVVGRNSSGDVRVGVNGGSSFHPGTSWGTLATSYELYFADVDGDAVDDAVLRHASTGELRVASTGIEDFNSSQAWGTSPAGQELVMVDADGDTLADVTTRASNGNVSVRTSTGTAFAAATFWGVWRTDADLRAADADGDTRGDVIGWKSSTRQIFVGLTTAAVPDGPPVLALEQDPNIVYDDEDIVDGGSAFRLDAPAYPMKLAFQDDRALIRRQDFDNVTPGVGEAQAERVIERVVQAGGRVIRFNALWGVIENHKLDPNDPITYNFEKLDRAVDQALDHGLVPYLTITGLNRDWECQTDVNPRGIACDKHDAGADPRNPDEVPTTGFNPSPEEFKTFVTAVVTHFTKHPTTGASGEQYKRVKTFSIWNEPNQKGFLAVPDYVVPNTTPPITQPVAPTDKYRQLYLAGYDAIKDINPDARVLIGELAGKRIEKGGRFPSASRFKNGLVPSVTALDFLEDVVRPRRNCGPNNNENCPVVRTDGVAIHPYQHSSKPHTRGNSRVDVGIGKLTGPAIDAKDPRPTNSQYFHYTGVNKTLDILHEKRDALNDNKRWLATPGDQERPQVYVTEFGYFNRSYLKQPDEENDPLESSKVPFYTDDARGRMLGGTGQVRGALEVAADANARWMLLFQLIELKPADPLGPNNQAIAPSPAWDTGLFGIPPIRQTPAGPVVDPAPVTGMRPYGKVSSGKVSDLSLNHDNARKAYCAVWKWADDKRYPTLENECA